MNKLFFSLLVFIMLVSSAFAELDYTTGDPNVLNCQLEGAYFIADINDGDRTTQVFTTTCSEYGYWFYNFTEDWVFNKVGVDDLNDGTGATLSYDFTIQIGDTTVVNASFDGTNGITQNWTVNDVTGNSVRITFFNFISNGQVIVNELVSFGTEPDTCIAPGSGDWNVDCSDNCVLDSDQDVVADMHLSGLGTIVLSSKLTFLGTDQLLTIGSGCTLDIRSGGEIGGT